MTLALQCLKYAIILPYVFTVLAKAGAKDFTNVTPRIFLNNLTGWRQRANWAQMNTFESLPGFIAGILVAHYLQAPQDRIDILAMTYLLCRILYGFCYIFNLSNLRSIMWFTAFTCILGLFWISV